MEEKSSEITYKFYIPEHGHEAKCHAKTMDMYSALCDIYQICRTECKHGDNENVAKFAERVKDLVFDVGLDDL